METSVSNSGSGGGSFPWEKAAVRIENPFTFKVGQVFTGVGVGCGLGIGVGRPLNLGAIPVLNQVMSAASGATYAFSGIGRHVNHSLKKIGAKNIEAGIGCGVGFGHGFGVGFAVKPGVIHQLQTCLFQAMGKMMMKLGEGPNLSLGQNILPPSVQSATKTVVTQSSQQSPMGNFVQLGGVTENLSPGLPQLRDLMKGSTNENVAPQASSVKSFSTRTEKVLSNFLQSPVLRDDTEIIETEGGKAEYEDRMLRMVLKHQQVIEELMEENEKLQRILLQDLKVSPEKLQPKALRYPCSDCFECRRRQRRR